MTMAGGNVFLLPACSQHHNMAANTRLGQSGMRYLPFVWPSAVPTLTPYRAHLNPRAPGLPDRATPDIAAALGAGLLPVYARWVLTTGDGSACALPGHVAAQLLAFGRHDHVADVLHATARLLREQLEDKAPAPAEGPGDAVTEQGKQEKQDTRTEGEREVARLFTTAMACALNVATRVTSPYTIAWLAPEGAPREAGEGGSGAGGAEALLWGPSAVGNPVEPPEPATPATRRRYGGVLAVVLVGVVPWVSTALQALTQVPVNWGSFWRVVAAQMEGHALRWAALAMAAELRWRESAEGQAAVAGAGIAASGSGSEGCFPPVPPLGPWGQLLWSDVGLMGLLGAGVLLLGERTEDAFKSMGMRPASDDAMVAKEVGGPLRSCLRAVAAAWPEVLGALLREVPLPADAGGALGEQRLAAAAAKAAEAAKAEAEGTAEKAEGEGRKAEGEKADSDKAESGTVEDGKSEVGKPDGGKADGKKADGGKADGKKAEGGKAEAVKLRGRRPSAALSLARLRPLLQPGGLLEDGELLEALEALARGQAVGPGELGVAVGAARHLRMELSAAEWLGGVAGASEAVEAAARRAEANKVEG